MNQQLDNVAILVDVVNGSLRQVGIAKEGI
jgi:hypothetical protein